MGGVGSIISSVASFISPIAQAVGIIGGLTQIFGATKAIGKTYKVDLPKFQIPAEELNLLKKQISGNIEISEQARINAIQALENYARGSLTPAYQSLYAKWIKNQEERLKAELARRGIPENSTLFREAMARLQEEGASLYANLLEKQLNDALRLSGLSETTIRQLLNKWQVEAGLTGEQARTILGEHSLRTALQQQAMQRAGIIGEGLANIARNLNMTEIPKKTLGETETSKPLLPYKTETFDLEEILGRE